MAIQYGIHDYREIKPTLNNPQLNFTSFTPTTFEWKPMDFGIYQKAVDKMDEADKEAREKESVIDEEINKQRKLIHQDADSLQRFDNIIAGYKQEIKNAVDSNYGSYHRVLPNVLKLAKDFTGDNAIGGMIQSNAKLEQSIQAMRNRTDLDENSKNMYEEEMHNRFNNGFVYDKNNKTKIIGANWQPNVTPIADIKPDDILKMAISLASPKKNTKGGTTTTTGLKDQQGNDINIANGLNTQDQSKLIKITNSEGGETTIEELSFDKLKRSLQNYINLHSEYADQIYEWQRKQNYRYKKLQEQYDDINTPDIDKQTIKNEMLKLSVNYGIGAAGGSQVDALDSFTIKMQDALTEYAYKNASNIHNKSGDFGVYNPYSSEKASDNYKESAKNALRGIFYGNSVALANVTEAIDKAQTTGEVESIVRIQQSLHKTN